MGTMLLETIKGAQELGDLLEGIGNQSERGRLAPAVVIHRRTVQRRICGSNELPATKADADHPHVLILHLRVKRAEDALTNAAAHRHQKDQEVPADNVHDSLSLATQLWLEAIGIVACNHQRPRS